MSRADFEKWAKDRGHMLEYFKEGPHAGKYLWPGTQGAYEGWQAAESHTARAIHDLRIHGAVHSAHICAAYPDAFKEGE